jgi:hypothetical protein
VSGGRTITFRPAEANDDDAIRALLRESPMHGPIRLAMTREPSFFRSHHIDGDEVHAFVAVEDNRIVCMGQIAIRERLYNGRARRVGYLGLLRLARSHAGRFDILSRGYAMARSVVASLPPMPLFTSVAADNVRAIRVLGSGRRGLPVYTPVGELVTLLFDTQRKKPIPSTDVRPTVDRSGHQFAPVWDDAPRAWNQYSFKQIRVCGYGRLLSLARPAIAAAQRLLRKPSLPRAGDCLDLSYAVLPPGASGRDMIMMLSGLSRTSSTRLLSIGLDARDPRLPVLQAALRPTQYRTRIFHVGWADAGDRELPDDRLMYPEIATL